MKVSECGIISGSCIVMVVHVELGKGEQVEALLRGDSTTDVDISR